MLNQSNARYACETCDYCTDNYWDWMEHKCKEEVWTDAAIKTVSDSIRKMA